MANSPNPYDLSDLDTAITNTFAPYNPDPSTWGPIISAASKKWSVPEPIIRGLMSVESSGGKNKSDSSAGAQGSMQIMPSTQAALGITDPHDPRQAIPGGTQYLAEGYKKYGNWTDALRYYQGGPDESKWGPQNSAYPTQVGAALKARGVDPTGLLPPSKITGQATSTAPTLTVAAHYDPKTGTVVQGTPSAAPPTDTGLLTDADIAAHFGAPGAAERTPATPIGPPPASPEGPPKPNTSYLPPGFQWGAIANFANNGLLGGGIPLEAGAVAAAHGASAFLGGEPFSQILSEVPQVYQSANADLRQSAKDWAQTHPVANATTALAGSLPSTLAVGGGLGALAKAGASAIGAAAPTIAPAIEGVSNFVGGAGGQGMTGIPGLLARMTSRGASGAIQGGVAQGANTGLTDQSLGDNIVHGAETGAVANNVLGPMAAGVSKLLNPKVAPALAKLALTPEAQAVGLRGGQVAQGDVPKFFDRLYGGHSNDAQMAAYSEALGKTAGVAGKELTPEALKDAREQVIGPAMEAVANRTSVQPDNQMLNDFGDIRKRLATFAAAEPERFRSLGHILDNVETAALVGLTGKEYQVLTGYKSMLGDKLRSPDGTVRDFAGDIREAIDGALERTAKANGNPEDVQAIQQLRTQYKNNLLIDGLADKSVSGLVNPNSVLGAVNRSYRSSFPTGTPIGNLAQLGQVISKTTPVGDSPMSRALAHMQSVISRHAGLAGLLGLGGLYEIPSTGVALGLAGGAAATAAASSQIKKMMLSPEYRNRLAQMALGQRGPAQFSNVGGPINPVIAALTQMRPGGQ